MLNEYSTESDIAPKTIIFFTTQTSGTGSIQRIMQTISRGKRNYQQYFAAVVKDATVEERKTLVPPKTGYVLSHNSPPAFNTNIDYNDYRFIINYRDPRDRMCNMYAWQFSHPSEESEEIREERVNRVREMGIDNWVLSKLESKSSLKYYDNIFHVLDNAPECFVATYAQLCCSFDNFVSKIFEATQFTMTDEIKQFLETERPEAIVQGAKWIGNKWEGSDVLPGRYKRELKPETIVKASEYFAPALKKMAKYDPEFADTYLQDVV